MRPDEAEKLALKVKKIADLRGWYDQVRQLCDYILSGDHKRSIENAAFERAPREAEKWDGFDEPDGAKPRLVIAAAIRALIQPPVQQKENGR